MKNAHGNTLSRHCYNNETARRIKTGAAGAHQQEKISAIMLETVFTVFFGGRMLKTMVLSAVTTVCVMSIRDIPTVFQLITFSVAVMAGFIGEFMLSGDNQ